MGFEERDLHAIKPRGFSELEEWEKVIVPI
jgi:hypothetical protein